MVVLILVQIRVTVITKIWLFNQILGDLFGRLCSNWSNVSAKKKKCAEREKKKPTVSLVLR